MCNQEENIEKSFIWATQYIEEKNLEKLKEEIRKCPEILKFVMALDKTLLHVAAYEGNPEIIEYLVSNGMDINKIVEDYSPINLAVLNNQKENVIKLIELGADLHSDNPIHNPLFTAINKGNYEIAQILINAGIDLSPVYRTIDSPWWDTLSYARYKGQIIIAKMIEKKLTEQGIEFEPYVYEDEVIITREEDDEIPEYEQDGNVYIGPYIQAKLGKIVKDIPELFPVADKVTVNIHVVKPRINNDFIALVTNGMSGDAMAYTEDGYKYAEVMIKLPPDWKMDENLFVDPKYSWPITILRKVAYLPHLHKNHYIDESTIIPFGHPWEPPVPFTEDTKL